KPKAKMSHEMLERVLREYRALGGRKINLTPFAGEILADRDILGKVRTVAAMGFDEISTYANLILLDRFDVNEFLEAGITDLRVSLAPLERETYIRIFRNRQYERLLSNLTALLVAYGENS